jgi:hypothetical protein
MKGLIDSLRLRWQEWTGEEDTPLDGDTVAWVASMFIHGIAFIVLFFLVIMPGKEQIELRVEFDPADEEEVEIVELTEVVYEEDPSEMLGAASADATEIAQVESLEIADYIDVQVEPIVTEVAITEVRMDTSLSVSPVQSHRNVMGARVGDGTTGAAGAVDRITYEILESLQQRKTLVVWMFDSTLSLKQQRDAISSRFAKIYDELGVLREGNHDSFTKHDDLPLLSAIVSYGEKVELVTKEPTDDVAKLREVVMAIENDASGQENTFTAVGTSAEYFATWRTQKRRNVMLIAVTDEVGSDERRLDEALAVVQRHQMPVYVVGVPAPFGRKEVPFRFVNEDPQYEDTEYWIPVHQGPESLRPETVQLAFWGSNREQEAYELIDSGFGPFSLTRLCVESGGIYFSVHPNRSGTARTAGRAGRGQTPANTTLLYRFWDPAIMRPYAPDYVTMRAYDQSLAASPTRMALVRAAEMGADAMGNPETRFVVDANGSLGEAALEAQKQGAVLEPKLERIHEVLKQGEKDRPNLTGLRWQAGYDLAMGRILAARVRTEGYNHMVAEIKNGKKFKDPKNNTWILVHSDETSSTSTLQTMADAARMYLKRVVDEHPDTPWAYLATKELETPLGWSWKEEFTPPPPMNMGAGNGNAPNPNDNLNMLNRKPRAPKPKL